MLSPGFTTDRRDGFTASLARGAAPAAAPKPVGVGVRDRREPAPLSGPPVRVTREILPEPLFRSALVRERKRVDRFDEVFVLLKLSAGPSAVKPDIGAIAAVTRQSDIVGWVEHGTAIAVIVPEVAPKGCEIAVRVAARIQRELARRCGATPGGAPRLRLYVHQGPRVNDTPGLVDADPLLDHIRALQHQRKGADAVKRTLDVAGSLVLLLMLAPVFLIIAALLKLTSRGPVLFRQERVGYMAKPFTMLKFRTMQPAADPGLHQQFVTNFIRAGAGAADERTAGGLFKIQHDPRVTPLGRLLRRSSLDELPQLWNVLRGEMSLVGPRPALRYELEHYRPWHWRRVLEGKPGITGLWQVVGRSRTTFDEMVRLDLQYVRSRGLWTDARVLLATPRAVITGKGAC